MRVWWLHARDTTLAEVESHFVFLFVKVFVQLRFGCFCVRLYLRGFVFVAVVTCADLKNHLCSFVTFVFACMFCADGFAFSVCVCVCVCVRVRVRVCVCVYVCV